MSQENVALVRQTFDAWNERGPEAAKQFYADDIEWHDFPGLPDRRVVRGRDAVAAHLTDQFGQVWEVASGRVERVHLFRTWEEALEAAGLSE